MLGFLLLLSAVSAEIRIYGRKGGEVELKPVGAPSTITSITWKYGLNLAVDWDSNTVDYYSNMVDYYGQFRDRSELNTSTGVLTLRGLDHSDNGQYTPEINAKALNPISLFVIAAVPVPAINTSCNEERTVCRLSCDADTAGAEPVTFVWRSDGQEVQKSKTLQIQKDNCSEKTLSCELKNPVSQENSFSINPFTFTFTTTEAPEAPKGVKISTGVIVFIALLLPVLLLAIIHRMISGSWFFQKESMPWEKDFWRRNKSPQRGSEPEDDPALEKEEE